MPADPTNRVLQGSAPLGRRAFLQGTTLFLAATTGQLNAANARPLARFGLFTDVHHADKPELRTRFYRESLTKLDEGLSELKKRNVEFLVCLGDLVDAADTVERERAWLGEAVRRIRSTGLPAKYVLGNHCVQTLKKAEFLAEAGQAQSHYSFDTGGVHFIVLDACYRKDGVSYDAGNFDWKDTDIPLSQREWLKKDLSQTRRPAIVLVHQRLDEAQVHSVANAAAVRTILEESGKVKAVFQGHSHQNDYQEIKGIHYCTMRAVIEGSGMDNNGYSEISVFEDGTVKVEGFRAQRPYELMDRHEGQSR